MKQGNRWKRLTALVLSVLTVFGCMVFGVSSPASAATTTLEDLKANLNAQSYATYYQGCIAEGAALSANAAAFLAADAKGIYRLAVDIGAFRQEGTKSSDTARPASVAAAELEAELAEEQDANLLKRGTEKLQGLKAAAAVPGSVYLPEVGSVTFDLDIQEGDAGLYKLVVEYYAISGSTSAIERMLYIDGAVPFAEARGLSMSKQWSYAYATDDEGNPILDDDGNPTFKIDRQGNSVRPNISQYFGWRTYECSDSDGFVTIPFEFYFEAGHHTLTLEGVREAMVIRSVSLVADAYTANNVLGEKGVVEEKILYTYEDYRKDISADTLDRPRSDKNLHIQAETPALVSDTSVYAANDRSSAITAPSRPDAQLLNTLGKSSYDTIGQWASYQVTVSEDGLYNVVLRAKQTALEGMFVSRSLLLWSADGMYGVWTRVTDAAVAATYAYSIPQGDGSYLVSDGTPKSPFEEAKEIRFDYNKDWVTKALGNGTYDFEFLFKKDVQYTLCLAVSLGQMAEILDAIESSLTVINQCYLNILQLTGPDPDEYRDYNFSRVMPATVRSLMQQSKVLAAQVTALEEACHSSGSNTATIMNISRLLEKMGSDEDEIAANLENLKSNIGTLGTWINTAKLQSVTVDYISVQSAEDPLPAANANFFEGLWFEICSFFASFYVDYDSMGVMEGVEVGEDRTIEVWLAYGRDQSQIWKNLIDNRFTPEQDIAVNLKLVAAGTLLPSVLAGQGPDAYIGLAASDVINYAIRGAIINIEEREGYHEVLGYDTYEDTGNGTYRYYLNGKEIDPDNISFNAACMIPISLYGKTYGLPETASLPMMFYRQDILANLGIEVPETWDDILSDIPVLQANNMEIGLNYANGINMFLYQFGSTQWKYEDDMEYAGAQINFDDPVALKSFNFCCRLYTDYSFPYAFDGPNRFRTGEMPILIADYVTTYNQLVVFATEIKNLWSFTSLPGVQQADGTVNNQSVVTLTATVMLTGCDKEDVTWQYMKWQADGEMQGQYGNEMVALVGPAAKYASANINGIKNLSWTAAEYESLMAQFQNLAAIPNYPGSYIIARYTQFAFLAAYNDKEDPTDAIEQYITVINHELSRKREEFRIKTLEDGETPEMVRAREQQDTQ